MIPDRHYVAVTTLCDGHSNAKAMSLSATKYYEDLARGIGSGDITLWEGEVSAAESIRMTDRAVMDIIGVRTDVPLPPADSPQPPSAHASAFHWIQLGIDLEEQQWV